MKFLRKLYYLYFRFGESALMLLENKYFTKSLHRNWRHWLFNPTEWQNKCQNKKLNDRINRKGTMKLYRFTLASEKTEGSKPSLDVLDSFSLSSDVPLVFLGYGEISAGTGFLAYYLGDQLLPSRLPNVHWFWLSKLQLSFQTEFNKRQNPSRCRSYRECCFHNSLFCRCHFIHTLHRFFLHCQSFRFSAGMSFRDLDERHQQKRRVVVIFSVCFNFCVVSRLGCVAVHITEDKWDPRSSLHHCRDDWYRCTAFGPLGINQLLPSLRRQFFGYRYVVFRNT